MPSSQIALFFPDRSAITEPQYFHNVRIELQFIDPCPAHFLIDPQLTHYKASSALQWPYLISSRAQGHQHTFETSLLNLLMI